MLFCCAFPFITRSDRSIVLPLFTIYYIYMWMWYFHSFSPGSVLFKTKGKTFVLKRNSLHFFYNSWCETKSKFFFFLLHLLLIGRFRCYWLWLPVLSFILFFFLVFFFSYAKWYWEWDAVWGRLGDVICMKFV